MRLDLILVLMLFRCYPVQEARDERKDDIRQPQCYGWRERVRIYEHLAESEEKDVGKGPADTDTDIPSDTTPSFLGRQGNTHDCQDERRERKGKAGVLLYQGELNIGITSKCLGVDQLVQFGIREALHRVLGKIEILHGKRDYRIQLPSAADVVGQIVIVLSDEIFLESPAALCRIIKYVLYGKHS